MKASMQSVLRWRAINVWTKNQKMRLNEAKTKHIIFNFSKRDQFTTDLSVNEKKIEIVNETRLLGTILTSDLKWDKNTKEIVKMLTKGCSCFILQLGLQQMCKT